MLLGRWCWWWWWWWWAVCREAGCHQGREKSKQRRHQQHSERASRFEARLFIHSTRFTGGECTGSRLQRLRLRLPPTRATRPLSMACPGSHHMSLMSLRTLGRLAIFLCISHVHIFQYVYGEVSSVYRRARERLPIKDTRAPHIPLLTINLLMFAGHPLNRKKVCILPTSGKGFVSGSLVQHQCRTKYKHAHVVQHGIRYDPRFHHDNGDLRHPTPALMLQKQPRHTNSSSLPTARRSRLHIPRHQVRTSRHTCACTSVKLWLQHQTNNHQTLRALCRLLLSRLHTTSANFHESRRLWHVRVEA